MKTALLITTYNRPEYLKRCLESLMRADYAGTFLFVDDCSSDPEISELIEDFGATPIAKKERKGIKDSLLLGYEDLFNDHDVVINLDADAIVSPNCFNELIRLKTKYPDRIITGFHSTTKNKDGSERHTILQDLGDVYVKQSVGGINMIANKEDYEQFIKPSLLGAGNWDHQTSIRAAAAGRNVLSVKQSLVEHIGLVSAMGHNHDTPDVATGFKLLHLPNVTLTGADSRDPHSLRKAAEISQQHIEFGGVKLFTDGPLMYSKSDYSRFVMGELYKHITTDYMLIIQADGFLINAHGWEDVFFNYDYIGASWQYTDGLAVGNGGYSLRSKRLMEIVGTDKKIQLIKDDYTPHDIMEDHCICRIYRRYLESEYGIKFAPVEIADRFSIEAYGRNMKGANMYSGQTGFHGFNVDFSNKEGYRPYDITKNKWKVINYNF